MKEQTIVTMKDVTVQADQFVLGPINISIPKGYVTAVVGANGSGKSTLFRTMLGLHKLATGEITIDSQLLTKESSEHYKEQIGYLPEQPWEHETHMRGKDKASFYSQVFQHWNSTYYEQLREKFQVDDRLRLFKMSKGMRRKLDFIVTLSHEPALLLLDEPSSGLDPLSWKVMLEVLHQYMDKEERSILMSSHIIDEVKRLADYILFVHHGKILGFFEKDELFDSWRTYIIYDDEISEQQLRALPGICKFTTERKGHYHLVTRSALEVEEWLLNYPLQSITRADLELDDVLYYLTQLNEEQEV